MTEIQVNPHHVDTILQAAGIVRRHEEFSLFKQMADTAVIELEHAMHHKFSIPDGNFTLDYDRKENRSFFIALLYCMQAVEHKSCWRTAMEYCKILMRLSAKGDDPLAVMLLIDQYAIKAHELVWLLEYYKSINDTHNLDMMPNFAYSIPLTLFYLSRGEGTIVSHKSIKAHLTKVRDELCKEDLRCVLFF